MKSLGNFAGHGGRSDTKGGGQTSAPPPVQSRVSGQSALNACKNPGDRPQFV